MSFLMPDVPDTVIEGNKLENLKINDSAYGKSISIHLGTVRTDGNVIWVSGLRQDTTSYNELVGGKGGGKGETTQTTIDYSYHGSFAIALGEGVGIDLLRIWFEGKLVYDQKTGAQGTVKGGLNFRFYGGTEEQLPDSLIQEYEGANAPAFRGYVLPSF